MNKIKGPLVSVCIPSFNMSKYIAVALKSVINQTYNNLEIIVMDNASSDNTGLLVNEFRDERIHYYKNEKTVEMYENFNRAFSRAQGEFIKFLCADDRLISTYVVRAMEIFSLNPSIGIVSAPSVNIDSSGEKMPNTEINVNYRKLDQSGEELFGKLIYGTPYAVSPSHVMFRRDVFENKLPFDSTLLYADFELWMRVLKKWRHGWIPEHLVEFRIHNSNAHKQMSSNITFLDELSTILNHHIEDAFPSLKWLAKTLLILRQAEQCQWSSLKHMAKGNLLQLKNTIAILKRHKILGMSCVYTLLHSPLFLGSYVISMKKETGE